ncbi:hypothetical protein V6N13_065508 [Hibiscus sabdariffa]
MGEILFIGDEELHGRDFSIKRAKILTNHMEFIEELISLSCEGDYKGDHCLSSEYDSSNSESSFVEDSVIKLQKNNGVGVLEALEEIERVEDSEGVEHLLAGFSMPENHCPGEMLLNGGAGTKTGLQDRGGMTGDDDEVLEDFVRAKLHEQ